MFVFALIANVTYVARFSRPSPSSLPAHPLSLSQTDMIHHCSILVRTTEWEKIKANMPWLLDAAVCVVLDLFVSLSDLYLLQYYLLSCPEIVFKCCISIVCRTLTNFNRSYCSTSTTDTLGRRTKVAKTTAGSIWKANRLALVLAALYYPKSPSYLSLST